MNYEKTFAPDGIRTRNRPGQRKVIYPLHYKYRLFITVPKFHRNYSTITVCFYKELRFKNSFVIDKYLYKQRLLNKATVRLYSIYEFKYQPFTCKMSFTLSLFFLKLKSEKPLHIWMPY